ncbi:MAG: replication-associated recombination protein A [Deltaproteobacteria bacterium]|jgi:putative ATPase|nr:replication-associated recombination protein A [Deltaproteobacteria bacterium]
MAKDNTSGEYPTDWVPLAQRMRPASLDDYIGQSHLVGPDKLLRLLYEQGQVASLILWGPPGVGKTSLARLLTQKAKADFVEFSAVLAGIKDVREVVAQAQTKRRLSNQNTVLFVDEIHRFNKAQQDAFLPHVESGLITLIGATTENPSFEIIPALISRTRVLVLEPLTAGDLTLLTEKALSQDRGLGRYNASLSSEALEFILLSSGGDARSLLNALELSVSLVKPDHKGQRLITLSVTEEAVQKKAWRYDKGGEEHYNLISALHKSLRDSDPDGALYWLARMLEGGEDPVYLLRRMIRFASEDVGMADPVALMLGTSCLDSYRLLGSPEGDLALAHLAVYLATAPKSNSVYAAFGEARADARKYGPLPVPLHIRNAPTGLMKQLGYGKGYRYAHDYEKAAVDQKHLPDELLGTQYYRPTDRGREKIAAAYLAAIKEVKLSEKT